MSYRVFKRSCTNWREFSSARKLTVERGLTAQEALEICDSYNDQRTARQIRMGTKCEFERE